jgi:ParB-like chromosome segregation protein Spo0J
LEVNSILNRNINKVKVIDVATVAGNKTLATGTDRRSIERCKEAIEKLGVVHTPVVGSTKDGNRLILSGQNELTALRELGVKKMDAIEVEIASDGGSEAKLSLLLISLQDRPGALCEGLLLREAVSAGVPRTEIQTMLGKSASWISNRLSLVTRLDINVYEMVKSGLLEPRSAQEIARLPVKTQFAFAEIAIREGLPKSVVESLVAGYNDESCPDTVKAQILSDPRAALRRMMDRRRAVNVERSNRQKASASPDEIDEHLKTAKSHLEILRSIIFVLSAQEASKRGKILKEVGDGLLALLTIVRNSISPGKTEVDHDR